MARGCWLLAPATRDLSADELGLRLSLYEVRVWIHPPHTCPTITDWDDFQQIPGCLTGRCTDVKDEGKRFLGGTDLREQAEGEKLKSIDDFNKAQSAGGAEAAPVLDRLRNAMFELGIDRELFDQVVDGMKEEFSGSAASESELLAAVSEELGSKLKAAMKAIAVDQLRIK